ncbi:ABC transporter permease subunit [Prochlorococcus sp. MIT 1341]|uniref:ABC transporter permease subunit n=1 Tax=Prochlorococcus sp. MIT 1341 TaxID=3096221 RepID=UPI002A75DD23|nr:ABC transporter permease subunit [Prochlorococcus sp. MIT 1341]
MKVTKKHIFSIGAYLIVLILITLLLNNLVVNLIRTNMGISFSWLLKPAGFALSEYSIPYKPSDNYAWALLIGFINALKVILASLFLSTFIGTIVGISGFSGNLLLKNLSRLYIALIRQIPLLLQLLFWYFVVILNLPNNPISIILPGITLSNKSINLLGIFLTPEFTALMIGLSVFTAASIAEVIRGAINAINTGQWEAFKSLGLSFNQGLISIILPQSLPGIIPGLTSQYLNLAKNSTLAIAIGYSDIYAIGDTTITQTGRAIEGFTVLLISFLMLNLIITRSMEMLNKISMHYQNDRKL